MDPDPSNRFNAVFPTRSVEGAPQPLVFDDFPRIIHPLVPQSKDFDFGVEEILPGSEIPYHHHVEVEEIIFIYKGQGHGFIGGEEQDIKPGSVLFIPKNTTHRIKNTSTTESLWLTYVFASRGGLGRTTEYHHNNNNSKSATTEKEKEKEAVREQSDKK